MAESFVRQDHRIGGGELACFCGVGHPQDSNTPAAGGISYGAKSDDLTLAELAARIRPMRLHDGAFLGGQVLRGGETGWEQAEQEVLQWRGCLAAACLAPEGVLHRSEEHT